MYVNENKIVACSLAAGSGKRRGKNEGKSHYAVENKWRKYVRNRAFHYVVENKKHRGSFPLYL
jgi:hypothetical protein